MLKYSVFLSVIAVYINCQQNDEKETIKNYASLEDPFRMQKCNLVWNKGRTKLTDKKLETLYSSLKLQDKSEVTLKRVKSEGGDKDGSMETEVRKKFNSILVTFGLGGAPEDIAGSAQQPQSKTLFKDKKLQRLWEKAELAGIHGDELATLQEEFKHHQRKVDEYNALLEMTDKNSKRYNEIKVTLEREELDIRNVNEIGQRGKDLTANYGRLHRLATNRGEEGEFEEPKVAGLWKMAMNSNFTSFELESIREELVSHVGKSVVKFNNTFIFCLDPLSKAPGKDAISPARARACGRETRRPAGGGGRGRQDGGQEADGQEARQTCGDCQQTS